jgi:CheY-like chemotaxis protein
LVAASDDALRAMLSAWLEEIGFDVLVASDARTALKRWKMARPPVTLIAAIGRGPIAVRLAARIRAAEVGLGGTACVLIAATGFANLGEYDAYRAAGFDSVLTWPLRLCALKARLAACGLLNEEASGHMLTSRAEAESLFWHGLAEDIEQLKSAARRESAADIVRWAHRIKGASLMFGQTGTGEVAALLEGDDTGQPPTDAARIAYLVDRLETLFQEGLASLAASPFSASPVLRRTSPSDTTSVDDAADDPGTGSA